MAVVPNTTTFSMQDVVNAIPNTSPNLVSCFAYSNAGYFFSSYSGSKDRLSNFRGYDPNNYYY